MAVLKLVVLNASHVRLGLTRTITASLLGVIITVAVVAYCATRSTPTAATTYAVKYHNNMYTIGVAESVGLQARWLAARLFNPDHHRPLIYGKVISVTAPLPDLHNADLWRRQLQADSPTNADPKRMQQEVLAGWPLLCARYSEDESGSLAACAPFGSRKIAFVWQDERSEPLPSTLLLHGVPIQIMPMRFAMNALFWFALLYIIITTCLVLCSSVSGYLCVQRGRCVRCVHPLLLAREPGMCPECGKQHY